MSEVFFFGIVLAEKSFLYYAALKNFLAGVKFMFGLSFSSCQKGFWLRGHCTSDGHSGTHGERN